MKGRSPSLVVADIGGTNARFALVRRPLQTEAPALAAVQVLPTKDFSSAQALVSRYLEMVGLEATPAVSLVMAVAGVVRNNRVEGTNIPWSVAGGDLVRSLNLSRCRLINDFAAAAWGVLALGPDRLVKVGGGDGDPEGNMAVLGPGTGLGEALIIRTGEKAFQVVATEGGHTDFAPATPEQMELLSYLQGRYHHVSWERVVSGMGIENMARFFAQKYGTRRKFAARTAAVASMRC